MPGKASRVYRSELRQQQAEQTRSRILAAAAELFAADGYSGTTLAKIAAAAGVSVETVQGHGPKAALLTAAAEYAAFGVTGEDNILNLDVGRKLLAIDDREEALDFLAAAQADIHQRTARLVQTLSAAASSDPKLDRYLSDVIASINLQTRRILAAYRDRGGCATTFRSTNSSRHQPYSAAPRPSCASSTATAGAPTPTGPGVGARSRRRFSFRRKRIDSGPRGRVVAAAQ